MLSERSQSQNAFVWNVQNRQSHRKQRELEIAMDRGEEQRKWLLMGTGFHHGLMKMFKIWLWWWMHNSVNTKSHFIVNFKWVNCMVLTMVYHDHLFLLNPIMSGFQSSSVPSLLPLLQPCWPPCVSWIYQTHSPLRGFALTLLW